jgi:hypothetical protein
MSLNAISTTKTLAITPIQSSTASTAIGGGGEVSFGLGSGAAGAYIAQGSGGAGGSKLLPKLLSGAVVGAGLGLAASFIPGLSFIPHFKILLPAIGAAVGAIAGTVWHFIAKKKEGSLAMEAQAAQAGATPPTTVAPAATGETLRMGSKGSSTTALQSSLKSLGLFPFKVNGTFDKPTQNAIRRYEVMKGVQPTGLGSPDLIAAVKQDSALAKQYV